MKGKLKFYYTSDQPFLIYFHIKTIKNVDEVLFFDKTADKSSFVTISSRAGIDRMYGNKTYKNGEKIDENE